jgi:hypothetical protein
VQIVGYDPRVGDDSAALLLATGEGLDSVPLAPETELTYTLESRHCAGTLTADGHVACDRDATPYCEMHAHTWVCARCTGACLKDEMDCYQDHAIYLAAFAPDQFKVGVTKRERLLTRLREQGAERAAHVRTVTNGRIAREIEAEIATRVGDSVRVARKIEGLHREVDAEAWNALLADFDVLDTFEFSYGLDLADRPVRETLATGTVRGTKGRILVLDRNGSTYAVDLRDLVGYEVVDEKSDRQLQSSLGAFG